MCIRKCGRNSFAVVRNCILWPVAKSVIVGRCQATSSTSVAITNMRCKLSNVTLRRGHRLLWSASYEPQSARSRPTAFARPSGISSEHVALSVERPGGLEHTENVGELIVH